MTEIENSKSESRQAMKKRSISKHFMSRFKLLRVEVVPYSKVTSLRKKNRNLRL